MSQFIAAIDQGTSSTRCIIFNAAGVVAVAQKEHAQIFPRPGWVEHDPNEIYQRTCEVVRDALSAAKIAPVSIAAIGIANQRETTVVWSKSTGEPYCNAIVWQDTRTKEICDALAADAGPDRFRDAVGLPLATYFSGPKLQWILQNVPGVRQAAIAGDALFGTIDSWLIWRLTGGAHGGIHVTDPTNASRTMLMNLASLNWDANMLHVFDIPSQMLPRIVPSSDAQAYGLTAANSPFGAGVPICGDLGDQQAALVGQTCFEPGESKNTYGTGCFMLLNTGAQPVRSRHGLLTTVAYRFAGMPTVYALEGSVAVAGSLVQWLRDNLGIIPSSAAIEALAHTVPDNGGVYFVPAFSGLYAPYWRSDARGLVAGLTRFSNKGHLARAALEATAFQTRDVLEAMRKDSGVAVWRLKVDGGMAVNDLLMQFQADILDVPVVRPSIAETTALGAAYAAGLAVGYFPSLDALRSAWRQDKLWKPALPAALRDRMYANWHKAIDRSMNWET